MSTHLCETLRIYEDDCDQLDLYDYLINNGDPTNILNNNNFDDQTLERYGTEELLKKNECKVCFKVDCQGEWDEWGECINDIMERKYSIIQEKVYNGRDCPHIHNYIEERTCSLDLDKKEKDFKVKYRNVILLILILSLCLIIFIIFIIYLNIDNNEN